MSPTLLLTLLAACLLALLPVWRLRAAGWPPVALFWAWVAYAASITVLVRFPGPTRFLLPILVLALVAPFVAGPERLARVLGGRRREERPVVDVTPRPAPGVRDGRDRDDGADPRDRDGEPGSRR